MGLCESGNNQAAANQATTAVTNAATTANTTANNQGGILSNITGALGSNNNQTTQNTGVLGTVSNLVGTNQSNQNTGVLGTVTNLIGNNNTTANSTSKVDTVVKVGQFVAQNQDALGNLVK